MARQDLEALKMLSKLHAVIRRPLVVESSVHLLYRARLTCIGFANRTFSVPRNQSRV